MHLQPGKKLYFASDFHLGVPDAVSSRKREQHIVRWLDTVESDAQAVFIVGDMFDFWFEYRHAIPKGYSRLIGKLCALQDAGIDIHLFHGNHDLWQFGYFESEIGCHVHQSPLMFGCCDKNFYIAHGDGLGPGQRWFKFILWIYRNRFFQRLFAAIHPNLGIPLANWFSKHSKENTFGTNSTYLGDDKEYLMLHAADIINRFPVDYFLFGHRHLPFEKNILNAKVFNLGDWFASYTYAVFDGNDLKLQKFTG